jgi:hypothetical protein
MRIVALAAMAIALLTVSAYSQGLGSGKKSHATEQKTDDQKKKPDDKGYKAAISKIPDRPYDPWRGVR